jgi:hypothetical protein
MAKWRNRICKCGKIDFTSSRSEACAECYRQEKKKKAIEIERDAVEKIYGNVKGPCPGSFGKRTYTFIHSCGKEQTWRYDNLLKQLKIGPEPCNECGAKVRMGKALQVYVDKYQLSERAKTDLRAYTKKVRTLSEHTYSANIDLINPERHQRMLGNQGHHLDHIISIVECFKRGWHPEQASALENLQMLTAGQNMSKGRL